MNDTQLVWHETVLFSELDEEEPTQVKIDNQVIAICKVEDEAFVINDICTHEHAFLSDGVIEDGCVECPLHQALFDVRTGKALTAPAIVDVKTYLTKIENNVVFVQL